METLRIMVCDDEPGIRLAALRSLRGLSVDIPEAEVSVDFVIDQAEGGEEALEIIAESPPDILLLDYKMPGISGLDVLERISQMNCEILPIMITAYASIETAVTATKQGAYDFLPKPFTPAELKNVIRKATTQIILSRQARNLAAEKRVARFQLIQMLGHELQTPLNVVEGYLQLIRDGRIGEDPEEMDRCIVSSMARIEAMRGMITDLLGMTRIEASRINRQLHEIDLVEVGTQVVESFQSEATRHQLTLELKAGGDISMVADRDEIVMLLNNLVSNAIKYNREDGRVDVSLSVQGDTVQIAVADTGIGISEDEMPRLFGEFVRIKNEKTRGILGSGLGLSIVKRLASLYSGEVTVDSKEDVGTTISVSLKRS